MYKRMTIFGKKMDDFGQMLGRKLSYNSLRQFGNKISGGIHKGLVNIDHFGQQVSQGLGKATEVLDGIRSLPVIGGVANAIGGGVSQLKSMVDLGRRGVQGLEKVVSHADVVGNSLNKAITTGDPKDIVGTFHTAFKNPLT